MRNLSDAQQASWALYAGVAAVVLAVAVTVLTALSVTCFHGNPNENTVLGPGRSAPAELVALLVLLAAVLSVVFGIQSVRRHSTDPRIHRRGVWGLVLGAISVPCCGPLSIIAGGVIGIAAQNCF